MTARRRRSHPLGRIDVPMLLVVLLTPAMILVGMQLQKSIGSDCGPREEAAERRLAIRSDADGAEGNRSPAAVAARALAAPARGREVSATRAR